MTRAFISAHTVVIPKAGSSITCRFCAKIALHSDGRRTLLEIAQRLHLPLAICEKLVRRALNRGWLEIRPVHATIAEQREFWEALQTDMHAVLGEESRNVLERAASMVGTTPAQVPVSEITDFLIAVELHTHESVREQMIPALDRLRLKFAC